VIAALGTGDRLSAGENVAYGIAYPSASERQDLLAAAVERLRDDFEVWVGAGAPSTNAIARSAGVALNMWNISPDEAVARAAGTPWNSIRNSTPSLVRERRGPSSPRAFL
jgi:Ni,Fe-hydrogenase III large subunit